ncbi:MAG: restriction endonuclease subunit S, partial [Desulfurococcus sp.]|uniref:restriction endonuclease subunit S n=1 Tax=Desulfurococcus sp. TaxID=51678 RepID=UPI00317366DB
MTTKKLSDYIKQSISVQGTKKEEQPKPAQARILFKKETELQETPIGKIPKDWKIATLKDIALISSGNTAPQEKKYFEGGKFPFIRVQHLNNLEEQKYPTQYDL